MLGNYPKLISTHVDPSLTTTNFRYSRWIFILICSPKLVLIKGISHTLITCTHHSRDCIRDDSCFQSNIYNASNMSLCYDPCCYDKILVNHSLIFHYHGLNVNTEATRLIERGVDGFVCRCVCISVCLSECPSAFCICLSVHCGSSVCLLRVYLFENTITLHSRHPSS